MKFSGFVKTSLIDYPGKVAAVVFTQGCNFRCGFCHNPDLIPLVIATNSEQISEDEVFNFLDKRKKVLDGIVITGGEPLIAPGIIDFITKVKSMDMKVKLDTNGSNPLVLRKLIDKKLVDYVAMDVKGPLANYETICEFKDIDKISQSIQLLLENKVDYEFRTTVLPYYHKVDDFMIIGKEIHGAKKYTIQGFRPQITWNADLSREKSFTRTDLEEIAEVMRPDVKEVTIHENL